MRVIAFPLVLAALACSPPASAPPADAPAPTEAPAAEAPVVDYGPYTGSWDAAEFSRFRHVLHARTPGSNALTLEAQTDSAGGETVAVYPIGPDGERRTVRLIFVVADRDGTSRTETVEAPAEGLPVEVVVENAGGRRHAGSYSLRLDGAGP